MSEEFTTPVTVRPEFWWVRDRARTRNPGAERNSDWVVPGYTEIESLGVGGSGRVVLARRNGSHRLVAIKYLAAALFSDQAFRSSFRDEAHVLADIRNPHVARLYEYVEAHDGAAIVMEMVNGVSLRKLLREDGPTTPEGALVVLRNSLLGLGAAHALGIVHRDYKPENVIVQSNGRSKLVDFGISARSGSNGPVSGTPSYMAPEQWDGAPATPSTDVYAATCVFFECVTGSRPYTSSVPYALLHQHKHAEIPVAEVPKPLQRLISRGLAKDPTDRPPNAIAFVAELEAAANACYSSGWKERGLRRMATEAARTRSQRSPRSRRE
jgi:serine/threonine-protein kinase